MVAIWTSRVLDKYMAEDTGELNIPPNPNKKTRRWDQELTKAENDLKRNTILLEGSGPQGVPGDATLQASGYAFGGGEKLQSKRMPQPLRPPILPAAKKAS